MLIHVDSAIGPSVFVVFQMANPHLLYLTYLRERGMIIVSSCLTVILLSSVTITVNEISHARAHTTTTGKRFAISLLRRFGLTSCTYISCFCSLALHAQHISKGELIPIPTHPPPNPEGIPPRAGNSTSAR